MDLFVFFCVLSIIYSDAVTKNCLVFELLDGKHEPYATLILSLGGSKLVTPKGEVFFPSTMKVEEMRDRILLEMEEYLRWKDEVRFECQNGNGTVYIVFSSNEMRVHGYTYFHEADLLQIWEKKTHCEEIKMDEPLV